MRVVGNSEITPWWADETTPTTYPQLTSEPLEDPLFQQSDRLRGIHATIWWQVLIDAKSGRNHDTPVKVWTDLNEELSVECEKRLILSERAGSGFTDPITYRTRKFTYHMYVPGMLQVNDETQTGRPLRRLAVSHDAPDRAAAGEWRLVTPGSYYRA